MLSKEEVQKIAKLAQIDIKGEEENLAKELGAILDYVEQLKELDTSNVELTAQVTGMENIFRPDSSDASSVSASSEIKERLISAFPAKENDHLKVKAVFEGKR